MSSTKNLYAGAAAISITPHEPHHLSGYPFVERISEGVHDELLSSALYLSDGMKEVLFIGNDIILISKQTADNARQRICEITGVPANHIMITATHTHSGPGTVELIACHHDELMPPIDENYVAFVEDKIVEAGCAAFHNKQEADLYFCVADATGIGTNRHNPSGACDTDVPLLLLTKKDTQQPIACMLTVAMHPTVLHEDSRLISGDFPGLARLQLQDEVFGKNIPVVYHMGTAGNQSPRHVTKENTFAEAERIASILVNAVKESLTHKEQISDYDINVFNSYIHFPLKKFPPVAEAAAYEKKCAERLKLLQQSGANKQEVRSAEVNWFGATELLHLAKISADKQLDPVYASLLPAEIQIIRIGKINFAGWPGEVFVEYGLQVKEKSANTFVITLANSFLQGYIVTEEASKAGVYESSNTIFDYHTGSIMVNETLRLLEKV